MSKKLLSEAQIRRFQSLASISPINEMGNYAMKRDEEQLEEEAVEEAYYKKDDEQPHEGMYKEEEHMEEEMDMDADDADMEDEDGDEEQVEVEEEMVEKAAAALSDLQALIDALGGEAAGDEMPDMDAEMPDMAPPEPADEPEEGGEEEDLLELALEGIQYEPSQKEIVQEVAKRVARRLVEAKQAHAKLNKALGNK
jgi:hypothetical protein